jgi:hypothetical protein
MPSGERTLANSLRPLVPPSAATAKLRMALPA